MLRLNTLIVLLFLFSFANAQTFNVGDYRSRNTGSFNNNNTWQRWNGTSWQNSGSAPTTADGKIYIENSHTVSIPNAQSATIDEVIINGGGTLQVQGTLNVVSGPGTDEIIVNLNGTLLNQGTINFTSSTMQLAAGGNYVHNSLAAASNVSANTICNATSNWIFRATTTVFTPDASLNGTYGNLLFENTTGGGWNATLTGSINSSCNDVSIASSVNLTNNFSGRLSVGGNFTVNGTIANGAGSQRFLFTGSGKSLNAVLPAAFSSFYDSLIIASNANIELNSNLTVAANSVLQVYGRFNTKTFSITGNAVGTSVRFFNNSTMAFATNTIANAYLVFSSVFAEDSVNYEVLSTTLSPQLAFWNLNLKNLTINTAAGLTTQFLSPLTVNILGTLTLTSGTFNVGTSTLRFFGGPIAGTSNNLTGTAGSFQFHGNSAGHFLPSSITSCNYLYINNPANVALNSNLTINGRLDFNRGILNCGLSSITITDTVDVGSIGSSDSSYANGTVIRRLKSGTNNNVIFPVGTSSYQPVIFNSVTTSAFTDLRVVPSGSAPTGTGDMSSILLLGNRHWTLSTIGVNNITSIGTVTLIPVGISPSLTSGSRVAISTTNTSASYSSLGGTVSGTGITSTGSWSAPQIADLSSMNGTFLSVGFSTLPGGVYCIGPSASYTPPGGGSYFNSTSPFPTITQAISLLNSNSFTGSVIFEIQNNYSSSVETFPITITFQGNPSLTATIRPRSDVPSTIYLTCNIPGFYPEGGIVVFDGADYVTIDGSPGGTMGTTPRLGLRSVSFVYRNIIFKNDARVNTINAVISESFSSAYNIYITEPLTQGNDSITISNCDILGDLVDISEAGIYVANMGSGTSASNQILINGNRFYNLLSGVTSAGGANGNINITNNSFYRVSSTYNNDMTAPIYLLCPNGANITISGNIIGGSTPMAGGSPLLYKDLGGGYGINVFNPTSTSTNTITSNIIKNINIDNLLGDGGFIAINVDGPANITNNTIGDAVAASSINFLNTNLLYADFKAIKVNGQNATSNAVISSNLIQNIISNASSNAVGSFYGIQHYNSGPNYSVSVDNNTIRSFTLSHQAHVYPIKVEALGSSIIRSIQNNKIESLQSAWGQFIGIDNVYSPANISGNRIGSWNVSNDISIGSNNVQIGIRATGNGGVITMQDDTIANLNFTGTGNCQVTGIYLLESTSAPHLIQRNVIKNISSASTLAGSETGGYGNTALTGIYNNNSSSSQIVTLNSITGLSLTNTSASANPSVVGIFLAGRGAITRNSIYLLTNLGTNTTTLPSIFGVKNASSTGNTIAVNMIGLTNGMNTNGVNLYGIYQNSTAGTNNTYFNSVFIGGSSINSLGRTSAFWVNSTGGTNFIRNNIFSNVRMSGAKNYAIGYNSGVTANWGTCNHNSLYSLNSSTLGAWPGTTDRTFATWKTASASDANSLNIAGQFIDGYSDLHLALSGGNCPLKGAGFNVVGYTTDFDLQTRSNPPSIGADEITFCTGAGVYCIGPSSSYTPPGGGTYINGNDPFLSLTEAVNALNSGLITGSAIFEIQNNYGGPVENYPILINFIGSPTFTATFRPRSDVPSTIFFSGVLLSNDHSQGLIELNGAAYVTFDGSPGGTMGSTSRLGFRLVSTTAASNFYISNDVQNVTLNALTLEGANNGRNVYIGGTPWSLGNDNITISNCEFKNEASSFVGWHIYSDGTRSGAAANSNLSITNNKFTAAEGGVRILSGYNGPITVTGNHFYQSNFLSTNTLSNGVIINTSEASTINVSGNFYGGSSLNALGNRMQLSYLGAIYPFLISNAATGSSNTISGNTIRNIEISYMLNSNGLQGFNVTGPAVITDNVVGDSLSQYGILFNSTNTLYADFTGINMNNSGVNANTTITGNRFQNITMNGGSGITSFVKAIRYLNGSNPHTITVSNNNVSLFTITNPVYVTLFEILGPNLTGGNTIVQNNKVETLSITGDCEFFGIRTTSRPANVSGNRIGRINLFGDITLKGNRPVMGLWLSGTAGSLIAENDTVAGFNLTGTGAYAFKGMNLDNSGSASHTVRNNLISRVHTNSTMPALITSPSDSIALIGINFALASNSATVLERNEVYELRGDATTSNVAVVGIYSSGFGTIRRNKISGINNKAANAGNRALLIGILNSSDGISVENNMISIVNSWLVSLNTYGILDIHTTANTNNYYFNTVLVSGSATGNQDRSYGYFKNGSTGSHLLRNNLFENSRGGGGLNFIFGCSDATPAAWSSNTSNYNCFYLSNSATFGLWGTTAVDFSTWKTNTGGDINTFQYFPVYQDGYLDIHLANNTANCGLKGTGITIAGISIDFDGDPRPNPPTVGADEYLFTCTIALNVKAYIQGYYQGTKMRPVLYNLNISTDSNHCDTVRIELRNTVAPYSLHSSYTGVIETNGNVTVNLPYALMGQSYYVVIKHRSTLETWSSAPQTLSSASVNYDFSTAANKAYGSNQIQLMPGIFGLYNGDISNFLGAYIPDGVIDVNDLKAVQLSCTDFGIYYIPYDLNGDLVSESADFSLIENNIATTPTVAKP